MKINSGLIRELRKKRGWTQEQLARVAGLGQRTVHRIENEGSASGESVMAIAAAFAVDTGSLLIAEKDRKPDTQGSFQSVELLLRLCLAVISGVIVAVLQQYTYAKGFFSFAPFGSTVGNMLSGAVFGLLVACPFLPGKKLCRVPALSLIVFSGLSFSAATNVLAWTMDKPFGEGLAGFLLASLAGSIVVLLAVRISLSMKLSLGTWLFSVVSGLFSGAIMYLGVYVLSDYEFTSLASLTGFSVWHCAMVLVLMHASRHSGNGLKGGTILDPVIHRLNAILGPRLRRLLDIQILEGLPDYHVTGLRHRH